MAVLVILAFFKLIVKSFPGLVFSPSAFKAWEIPANLIAIPPDFISVELFSKSALNKFPCPCKFNAATLGASVVSKIIFPLDSKTVLTPVSVLS